MLCLMPTPCASWHFLPDPNNDRVPNLSTDSSGFFTHARARSDPHMGTAAHNFYHRSGMTGGTGMAPHEIADAPVTASGVHASLAWLCAGQGHFQQNLLAKTLAAIR